MRTRTSPTTPTALPLLPAAPRALTPLPALPSVSSLSPLAPVNPRPLPPLPTVGLTAEALPEAALATLRDYLAFDGCTARLTCGDIPHFAVIKTVMERLRGKWVGRKVMGFVFPYEPEAALRYVVREGRVPEKNPTDFFPTTGRVQETLIEYATLPGGMGLSGFRPTRVLEPSAGDGALLEAIYREMEIDRDGRIDGDPNYVRAIVDAVEFDPVLAAICRQKGFSVWEGDFLAYAPSERYDRIVMNPPFRTPGRDFAYIDHVRHAWDLLADDGILVAVIPGGWEAPQDNKRREFAEWLSENAHVSDPIHGGFKSQGTGVTTYIITCLA